ncbi:hypothetical protein [Streptomyces massasporeus]
MVEGGVPDGVVGRQSGDLHVRPGLPQAVQLLRPTVVVDQLGQ